MSTNLNPVSAASQSQITPEIHDAMEAIKVARGAAFQLSAEYFGLDWETRTQLAEELYRLADDLPVQLADITLNVTDALEDETEAFDEWETRLHASQRMYMVVRALEGERKGVAADVF